MYYWMYNAVLHLALPFIAGLFLVKKRLQRGLKPRFGIINLDFHESSRPVIWVHAVSLGETLAVVPLLRSLKQARPHANLVVSTVTETGKEVVCKELAGIATHCYAPLDFPWAVDRYIRQIDPSLFILIESEFWPNLLRRLHAHRVPICLVNGRISTRSYSRYRLIRGLMRRVFGYLSLALMQSDRDGQRALDLGVRREILHVTGNMKFDRLETVSDQQPSTLISRTQVGLKDGEWLWVAGSTHPEEEEMVLEAYRTVVRVYPHLVLMLAPRHIERTEKVENAVRKQGLSCVRRSQIPPRDDPGSTRKGNRVIVLDTRGELARMYRLGHVGFVGGTLVPVGGHNLLEPAQWARPVLFGPFIDHCQEIASLLLDGGGGIKVRNTQDLAGKVMDFLADPEKARAMGERAFSLVQQQQGVVARNLSMVLGLLDLHEETCYKSVEVQKPQSAASTLVR